MIWIILGLILAGIIGGILLTGIIVFIIAVSNFQKWW